MKQVVISLVVVLLAAGIFAGMVLYTVSVLRLAQTQILTGQYQPADDRAGEESFTVYWE